MAKKKIVDRAQEVAKALKCNADRLVAIKNNEVSVYGYYNTTTKLYTPNLLVLPKATEEHHALFFERHLFDMYVTEGNRFVIDLEVRLIGHWNLSTAKFKDNPRKPTLLKLVDVYSKFDKIQNDKKGK